MTTSAPVPEKDSGAIVPDDAYRSRVPSPPVIIAEFAQELVALGWVTDLLVGGSASTGDYVAGVSDLDLVAVVNGPVEGARRDVLVALHSRFDRTKAAALNLGCVYVEDALLGSVEARHPTWTHGSLVRRPLSRLVRAELVRHGYAAIGRSPREVLPLMSDDEVRDAARAELTGYWHWASRRPVMWLDPAFADLGLTSMARGRHALAAGSLLTKTQAIEEVNAPAWLVHQLRARRRGERITSPRFRTALIAWRDARRTVAAARRV